MDYESRIFYLQRLSRSELLDKLQEAVTAYDDGLAAISASQSIYDNSLCLIFAVLAVEDGHYYECEHNLLKIMLDGNLVSLMRRIANDIVATDGLIGAEFNLQGLFDRLSYKAVDAALDLSICYFLLTGGMTPSRKRLLSTLFYNY